jgi:Bacterial pre-peptidase C-terminal domain/PEP-CTERM motif
MKKLIASLALLAAASVAQAGLVTGSGFLVNQAVDWYSFSSTTAGTVTIRATETVVDGSDFDPVIFLLRNDGNLTADDFIAYDDDSGSGPSGLESLLIENLAAGNYWLAVATHGAQYIAPNITGGHHLETDYTLSISGDGVVGNNVPEPASWALAGLGLLAAGVARKRKQV